MRLPTERSVGPKSDAEKIKCALLDDCWLSEHIKDGDVGVDGLNSVIDDGGKIAEQRLKAMHLHAVTGVLGKRLELSGSRALRGSDDGSACGLCVRLVIVVEKDRCEKLAHMPFDIISQHAK